MLDRFDHGGDIYSRKVDLDFSVNINPLGMPDAVKRAVIDAADTYKNYPDPKCRALRAALAEHLGCGAERIICGNGAADLIIRLCLSLKPKRVLVCAPTFSEYEKAALMAGAEVKKHLLHESDGYAPTESVLDGIDGCDIFFICNPNNPTGALTPPALMEKIAKRCKERGAVLAIDECFLSFTGAPSSLPLLEEYDNVLILNAFTKLYSIPGLRLGYAISSNERLLGGINAFGQSWNVSGAAQAAGVAALGLEPEWTRRTQAFVRDENAYVRAALRGFGFGVWDGAANYTMFRAPAELGGRLLDRGILIRSCSNYTGLSPKHWRIGIKQRAQNDALLTAIAEALGK